MDLVAEKVTLHLVAIILCQKRNRQIIRSGDQLGYKGLIELELIGLEALQIMK